MYTCDNLTVTPGQYAAIQSGSCDQSVPGSCFVGGTVYDLGFFTAVKYGDCSSTCSEAPEVSIGQSPCSACDTRSKYVSAQQMAELVQTLGASSWMRHVVS